MPVDPIGDFTQEDALDDTTIDDISEEQWPSVIILGEQAALIHALSKADIEAARAAAKEWARQLEGSDG